MWHLTWHLYSCSPTHSTTLQQPRPHVHVYCTLSRPLALTTRHLSPSSARHSPITSTRPPSRWTRCLHLRRQLSIRPVASGWGRVARASSRRARRRRALGAAAARMPPRRPPRSAAAQTTHTRATRRAARANGAPLATAAASTLRERPPRSASPHHRPWARPSARALVRWQRG